MATAVFVILVWSEGILSKYVVLMDVVSGGAAFVRQKWSQQVFRKRVTYTRNQKNHTPKYCNLNILHT